MTVLGSDVINEATFAIRYVLIAFLALVIPLIGGIIGKKTEIIKRVLTIWALILLLVALLFLPSLRVGAFVLFAGAITWEWSRLIGKPSPRLFPFMWSIALLNGLSLYHWELYSLPIVQLIYIIAAVSIFLVAQTKVSQALVSSLYFCLLAPMMLIAVFQMGHLQIRSLLLLIMLLQFADVLAFAVGKKWGRHKPFPTLSPGKSLEGIGGTVLGVCLGLLTIHWFLGVEFPENGLLIFLLILGLSFGAVAGDLFFSKIKRSHNIKDFGSVLPGHGGLIDRFDNFLFVAPIFLGVLSK